MSDELNDVCKGPLFRGDHYPELANWSKSGLVAEAHRSLLLDAARKVGVSFMSGVGTQESVHGLLRIVREIEEEMEGHD